MSTLNFPTIHNNLTELNKAWSDCSKCDLRVPSLSVVPGIGATEDVSVIAVGQYPTYTEAKSGKSFQGQGAAVIRSFLEHSGVSAKHLYLTNALKCPSLDANSPVKKCVRACIPYMQEEVAILKPKLIIALGKVAMQSLSDHVRKGPTSVDQARSRIFDFENVPVITVANPMAVNQSQTPEQKAYNEKLLLEDSERLSLAYKKYVLGEDVESTTQEKSILPADIDIYDLHEYTTNCKNCPLHTLATHKVFGRGPLNTDRMIVGEAPGKAEDKSTQPFVGYSGEFFSNLLMDIDVDEKEWYITNAVKCRPMDNKGKDRKPTPIECLSCAPILNKQINTVRPKVILALGRVAVSQLWGYNIHKMSDVVGQVRDSCIGEGIKVVASWHPAFITRLAGTTEYSVRKQELQDCVELALQITE